MIPMALGSLSTGLLISLLSLLFLNELAEPPARQGRVVAALTYYGEDVERFIGITAKTGALTALANLVLLMVVGVEFPLLWCVLYLSCSSSPTWEPSSRWSRPRCWRFSCWVGNERWSWRSA